jgi:hypothetical protein
MTIEDRRTAVPVHLDRQHGAFHGTNPELGSAMFGDPRSTVASLRMTHTTIMIGMPGVVISERSRARDEALAHWQAMKGH